MNIVFLSIGVPRGCIEQFTGTTEIASGRLRNPQFVPAIDRHFEKVDSAAGWLLPSNARRKSLDGSRTLWRCLILTAMVVNTL